MINVFGSCVGTEELINVQKSIETQWMGAGCFVKEFESKFSNWKNTTNFLMLDNASNGLFMACRLLNLPAGSEIILPSFTCIACAQAIKMANYVPVFCDVDKETQNIKAEFIIPYITSRTAACMVVHYAGLPVDMEPIKELGLKIIEDAAHAVDSKYKGQPCGTIGDIGVFSFDPVKNLATCEGGGIILKDSELYVRANYMRLCGVGNPGHKNKSINMNQIWWEDHAEECFIKTYPNDISAGIALAQLEKLEYLQERRKKIWNYYTEFLSKIPVIKCPEEAHEDSRHSYFTYCIQTSERNELAFYLYEKGIYSTLRFYPLHLNKLYKNGQQLKNTEFLSKAALNIPLHPALSDSYVEYVVDHIRHFYK